MSDPEPDLFEVSTTDPFTDIVRTPTMTIVHPEILDELHLGAGKHQSPTHGTCLLEAVAYIAGEKHSDHPECASPTLGAFGRELNDVLPDDKRQRLVPLVPLIVGTADDGHDEERGLMALDWLIRTYTPAWLDLAGLTDEAQELRDLRRIVDDVSAAAAKPAVLRAHDRASAAWSAAGSAARSAAQEVLAPTVDTLQDSAIELFTQIVNVGR